MTKFKLSRTSHLWPTSALALLVQVLNVSVLRLLRCVTRCGSPSLPKTFSKIHRKKAHWCSWPTTPHTVPFRKRNKKKSQYCTVAQEYLFFFLVFVFCYRYSKYQIIQEGKQAAGRTSLLNRKLNYVHVSFITSPTFITKKSIQVHHFLLCTVLTLKSFVWLKSC